MTEPTTVNVGLIIPNTGDLAGTWGSAAVNPDFVALDGYFGGVQAISLSNVNVTLTAPAGFAPTPGGGPTQAQNAVLKFTGTLTGNVRITLPLPGFYIIDNQTTGNFILSFQGATATQVIGFPPGECHHIYNDGANVKFVNLGAVGVMEFWAGYSAMPSWVAACTVPPYLMCNAQTFSTTTYPILGARFGSNFGGNGSTTAAVPDLGGRVPLMYDTTGTRITSAGSGINGQTIGAAGGSQGATLSIAQLPAHSHTITDNGHSHTGVINGAAAVASAGQIASSNPQYGGANTSTANASTGISINNTGSGTAHFNVQPSQVCGIWVMRMG